MKTIHPLIYSAKENSIPFEDLNEKLHELDRFCKEQNLSAVLSALKKIIPEWINSYSKRNNL